MKHLRRFNESLNEDEVDELKDFCEMGLAYLLDEDFIVDIDSRFPGSTGNVSFNFKKESGFTWDEIADQFIPFLQRLSNRYIIVDRIRIGFLDRLNSAFVSFDSLVNVNNVYAGEIKNIFIRIVDKK